MSTFSMDNWKKEQKQKETVPVTTENHSPVKEWTRGSLETDIITLESEIEKLEQELKKLPGYRKYYEEYKNGILITRMVKCGNKTCRCQNGTDLHGPYLYFQFNKNGKLHQKYLRKTKETDKIVDLVRKNQELKKARAKYNKAVAALKDFEKKQKEDNDATN